MKNVRILSVLDAASPHLAVTIASGDCRTVLRDAGDIDTFRATTLPQCPQDHGGTRVERDRFRARQSHRRIGNGCEVREVLVVHWQATAAAPRSDLLKIGWVRVGGNADRALVWIQRARDRVRRAGRAMRFFLVWRRWRGGFDSDNSLIARSRTARSTGLVRCRLNPASRLRVRS